MSRSDQYNVTVAIDHPGLGNLGTWDRLTGGDADSEETKYWPGGMQPQISLGGRRMVENVTVARLYALDRDAPKVPGLLSAVGKASVTITKQSLDVDGNAFGRPLVYTGKLKSVSPPDHNSESNDAALIELEISSAQVAMA